MELFTEIEFGKDEFGRIHKVLYFLTAEGWEIINTVETQPLNLAKRKRLKLSNTSLEEKYNN